jgi:hypothetical protein
MVTHLRRQQCRIRAKIGLYILERLNHSLPLNDTSSALVKQIAEPFTRLQWRAVAFSPLRLLSDPCIHICVTVFKWANDLCSVIILILYSHCITYSENIILLKENESFVCVHFPYCVVLRWADTASEKFWQFFLFFRKQPVPKICLFLIISARNCHNDYRQETVDSKHICEYIMMRCVGTGLLRISS